MKKYNLPSNHSLFTERTLFDLAVECYEDYFTQNPLERHRNDDGFIQLKNTGDAQIDLWEEQIAQGITPDLLEVFPPEELEKLQKMRSKATKNPALSGMSLKGTVEAADREAAKLQATTNPSVQHRPGWTRGFGDGT